MYQEYYGFKRSPFKITPDTDTFYTGGNRGSVLQAIIYAINSGDAIIKIVGEVGSGKTMLCRMLETKLPDSVDIVYLANPRLTPDNILQAIAFELNLPISQHQSSSRVLMLRALHEHLLDRHIQNRKVVVFVEEAQGMPLETLEEIRLLTNIETGHDKLLQIVLFGQPELDENLNNEHVRQIRDRISNSFYLSALSVQETGDYLLFRLFSSGYQGPQLFNSSAIRLLAKASHGYMRRINILADKALLAAYAAGSRTVTRVHVTAAIRDTQQQGHAGRKAISWFVPALVFSLLVITGVVSAFLFDRPVTKTDKTQHTSAGKKVNADRLPHASTGKTEKTTKKITLRAIPGPEAAKSVTQPANRIIKTTTGLHSRINLSEKWLKKVDHNRFTIQVLLTNADAMVGLERFLGQEGIRNVLGKIYLYRTSVRGIPMIGVLYGEYGSYSEAAEALKAIPAALKRYQPYVRVIRNLLPARISNVKGKTQDRS